MYECVSRLDVCVTTTAHEGIIYDKMQTMKVKERVDDDERSASSTRLFSQ